MSEGRNQLLKNVEKYLQQTSIVDSMRGAMRNDDISITYRLPVEPNVTRMMLPKSVNLLIIGFQVRVLVGAHFFIKPRSCQVNAAFFMFAELRGACASG